MLLATPLSHNKEPLFRQVYLNLRTGILSGTLRGGEKLPSTRDAAEQLGISRTVVLLAYDQLLAEGFVVGRRGSGTYVSKNVTSQQRSRSEDSAKVRLSRFGESAANAWLNDPLPRRHSPLLRYDFAYGRSDLETFPFEMWRRFLLRCARKAPVSQLDYGPPAGNPALREAICAHVRRSRSVVCDSSQVIVVNGSQQAMDLIARALIERGEKVAIEEPTSQGAVEIFRAAGARLLPVSVDRDGLDPSHLPLTARLAFVTPSHQFPTGTILSLPRRLELLRWAKRANAVVIEDDYDGEFRYDSQPLESLQSLDQEGRVIYVGTFSRTVFSALRIGYLIAPKALIPALAGAKWLNDRHTATLEQQALAEFISLGIYERYLRRVRRRNAARRQALLESVEEHLDGGVEVTGDSAGAHIVIWPKDRVSERELIAEAAERGVGVYATSPFFLKRPSRVGIMLGYARLKEAEIREGIRRLGEAFKSLSTVVLKKQKKVVLRSACVRHVS